MAAKAFEGEFRCPEMVANLHSLLNLVERRPSFARLESLVQSSGWGKSRSICELWRQGVWVVYCCLGQGSGYPRRSPIADWFLGQLFSMMSMQTENQLKSMAFCLAYFEASLLEMMALKESEPSLTPQKFVKLLYRSGDNMEDCFGDTYDRSFAEAGTRFWEGVRWRMEELLRVHGAQRLLVAEGKTQGECWREWEHRAALRMQPTAKRVSATLSATGRGVKILFVFDEAWILGTDPVMKNLYLPLRRATSAFKQGSGILTLFSDTEISPVAKLEFSAPVRMDPSDRLPGTNSRLANPIWACFWADHGIAEWSSLCCKYEVESDALSRFWPVRYGRPMWWSAFKALLEAGFENDSAFDVVINLACDKLLGGAGAYAKHVDCNTPLTSEMAIAVIGSRCALSIDPRCSAVSSLVAHNLMTLVKVDEMRERMYADWPMEPLVALAAARIMRELDDQGRFVELIRPLAVALNQGWVSDGSVDELLARILLIWAFDKATDKLETTWCTVDEFVEELLGTSLLKLVPEVTEKVQALASSKLCFTALHNIQKKSLELTTEDFQHAAARRCGIVAQDNSWGIEDHVLTDEKGKVCVHSRVKRKDAIAHLPPPLFRVGEVDAFLSLQVNVRKSSDKVSVVDPQQVEQDVRQNNPSKVLQAVLAYEAEKTSAGGTAGSGKRKPWEKQRDKHPRLFEAWHSWLHMPRDNQIILKVHGLGAFKPLLGDDLFAILQRMPAMACSPLLDPSNEFEAMQMQSVNVMFPGKNPGLRSLVLF